MKQPILEVVDEEMEEIRSIIRSPETESDYDNSLIDDNIGTNELLSKSQINLKIQSINYVEGHQGDLENPTPEHETEVQKKQDEEINIWISELYDCSVCLEDSHLQRLLEIKKD